ncbi:MAG: cbb3-type cytochrome c oxidase subunit I [Magnetococcales bacterium]|nr:cbb3-type cytochrome c oxidase subunit I [Magnetococcales bacterium]
MEEPELLAHTRGKQARLALRWLLLALAALLASSLFALLLIVLRSMDLSHWLGGSAFFAVAIALHVNLAVLVWFLSFAGLLWSLPEDDRWQAVSHGAWILAAFGTGLILLSPWLATPDFWGGATRTDPVVLSNYLPILRTPSFFAGLALFGGGILLLTLRTCAILWSKTPPTAGEVPNRTGLLVAAISLLLALLALLHAAWNLRGEQPGVAYYETLFWGMGHLLQFLHTFLMLTVWLWLAPLAGLKLPLNARLLRLVFVNGLLPALLSPLFFLVIHPNNSAYRLYFTQLMSYASWLAFPIIGITIAWQWLRHAATDQLDREQGIFRSYLLFSLFLFVLGILIGSRIEGDSVMVTAHYHGTVGAVTMAYMGITFHLLPRFGFRRPLGRWHQLQPYLYGGGLTLLILGLTGLGLYGVPRKTPLTAQATTLWESGGVALLGIGGAVGLLGSFLFLWLVFLSLRAGGDNRRP